MRGRASGHMQKGRVAACLLPSRDATEPHLQQHSMQTACNLKRSVKHKNGWGYEQMLATGIYTS